jgi:hypothetical protein
MMHSKVRSTDLFHISKPIDSMSWAFLVNRLQTLYYIISFPNALTEPSMIWIILLAAACSHLNIWLLGNWFRRKDVPDGYLGTLRMFGTVSIRLFAFAGLLIVLVKCIVLTLGYVEIVHQILFPSVNPKLFVVLLMLACLYLARQGMEQTIRFSVIAYIGSVWLLLFSVPFFFPPQADYYHLLPLIPDRVPSHAWHAFVTIWAAFAGPEYLLVLSKRATNDQRFKTSLLIGNALTAFEYVILFVIALMFYGSEYLRRLDLPIIQLIRYIQLPFGERLEMIIIPTYFLSLIYVDAVLLLYTTGALRILTGASHRPSGRKWLWLAFVLLLSTILAAQHWIWANETESDRWIEWHTWLDASTYAALPVILFIANFLIKKRGTRHATNQPAD